MSEVRPLLLVVDDDPGILTLIEHFASQQNINVITRPGGRSLLDELPTIRADVALVDLKMPEVDGLEILKAIRETDPVCQVILMPAYSSIESAIDAIKLGALDYLRKPLDFDRIGELLTSVRYGIERRQRLFAADAELAARFDFYGIIGRTPIMQELFDMIRQLAPYARTALITGETGTGKELAARALHKLGPRRDRRFVVFNCSTLVESLAESELFGHTRGAFTGAVEPKAGLFEKADGGTLFLDEIGELPPAVQAKLLRVIEYGDVRRVGAAEGKRVDVHVVAATNRQLAEDVVSGRFRQDLYYRLNVVEINLPPLRERREDIGCLTAAFVNEFSLRFKKGLIGVSPGAERLLHNATWPGNVRELRNVVERACMLNKGRILNERDVLGALGGSRETPQPDGVVAGPAGATTIIQPALLPTLDRASVQRALQRVGGNRSAAARLLGMSRRALYRRLDAFGLR